jgi:hypothetical protein
MGTAARKRSYDVGVLALGVVVALGGTGTAGAAQPAGIAPTVSGLPAAPYAERTLRVGHRGAGIRFRAPATGRLAAVNVVVRRPGEGCTIALHESGAKDVAVLVASAPLPDGKGWVEVSLDAGLVAERNYDLIVRCEDERRAQLGYVLDHETTATRSGAWRVVRVRKSSVHARRRHASPLFALRFADGTWWGQPYRAARRRPLVRICGQFEATQTIVPRQPVVVGGLRLPRTRNRMPGLRFTLVEADGRPLLAGPFLAPAPGDTHVLARPTMPDSTVTLEPGREYTVRLEAARDRRCFRERALTTDLPLGPALLGLEAEALRVTRNGGRTWEEHQDAALSVTLLPTPVEERRRGATCGDEIVQSGEDCDGGADAACPGRCTATCDCAPPPPARSYRTVYADGYFGVYDGNDGPTVREWPKRLGVIQGSADGQGPLVADAKRAAAAAGNEDARFIFYSSLTSLDTKCRCSDARLYESFIARHPEWMLRDPGGQVVSAFVPQLGTGRQLAVDIGNPDFIDAWIDWILAASGRYGWDGVFADNVARGSFYGWSTIPVNPRTGARYTTAEYRRDLLAALRQIRRRLDAAGKIIIGNHGGGWEPDTFTDPVIRDQVLAMHGTRVENCVFNHDARPLDEAKWIAQLQYFDFANRNGVLAQCQGANGTISGERTREYLLATTLLTKEGFSGVAELNTVDDWWDTLELDLGAPAGGFTCLDPDAGLVPDGDCPSLGKIYAREWERGRVLVNPSVTRTVRVPLERPFLLHGTRVSSVSLGPQSGVVLAHP